MPAFHAVKLAAATCLASQGLREQLRRRLSRRDASPLCRLRRPRQARHHSRFNRLRAVAKQQGASAIDETRQAGLRGSPPCIVSFWHRVKRRVPYWHSGAGGACLPPRPPRVSERYAPRVQPLSVWLREGIRRRTLTQGPAAACPNPRRGSRHTACPARLPLSHTQRKLDHDTAAPSPATRHRCAATTARGPPLDVHCAEVARCRPC